MNEPYITYKEKDSTGTEQTYIVQKGFPHFSGMVSLKPQKEIIEAVPFPDMKKFMVFNYTLRGKMIPGYQKIDEEARRVMVDMIHWFLNKIIQNEQQ